MFEERFWVKKQLVGVSVNTSITLRLDCLLSKQDLNIVAWIQERLEEAGECGFRVHNGLSWTQWIFFIYAAEGTLKPECLQALWGDSHLTSKYRRGDWFPGATNQSNSWFIHSRQECYPLFLICFFFSFNGQYEYLVTKKTCRISRHFIISSEGRIEFKKKKHLMCCFSFVFFFCQTSKLLFLIRMTIKLPSYSEMLQFTFSLFWGWTIFCVMICFLKYF